MNIFRIFKKTKPEPKPEPQKTNLYELKIIYNDGERSIFTVRDFYPKGLIKAYYWFLVRESNKYNIKHKKGMKILLRKSIKSMEYTKKEEWV